MGKERQAGIAGENITIRMIPEFELSAEVDRQTAAWGALDDLDKGLSPDDVYTIYGLSVADIEPYRATWPSRRPLA